MENIIPGLTRAFERQYGFKINQNPTDFKIYNYVIAGDGKFYKYNDEFDNIYYGPNNIIIDKFNVQKKFLDKSRYIVIGVLILDLKEKKLFFYSQNLKYETLPKYVGEIEKIELTNLKNENKKVTIINNKGEVTNLILSAQNRLIGFINNHIQEINDNFFLFLFSIELKYFEARNLVKIGDRFLNGGCHVKVFIAPKLKEVGIGFLAANRNELEILDCPNLEKVGYNFLKEHDKYRINLFDKRVTSKSRVQYAKVLIKNKVNTLRWALKR